MTLASEMGFLTSEHHHEMVSQALEALGEPEID